MPEIALVPRPSSVEVHDAAPFVLDEATTVVVEPRPELIQVAVLAADLLGRVAEQAVQVRYRDAGERGVIKFSLTDDVGADSEAYRLEVAAGRIDIQARTTAGLVRAVVTLRQLLTRRAGSVTSAPAVTVEDSPRYAWRGLSIDVARHFLPVDDLKVVIGVMVHYKLNVLHLHLTDDQGWRLQIPSRPNLTRLSGGTAVDGDPGGYYSQGDFATIVQYAAARGVRVVPEIDVPGHVNAATHAYGELTPSGEPTDVYTGVEVGFSTLTADLPATTPFLQAVFADVAAVSPDAYIHIGGDEALNTVREEYTALVATASKAVRATGRQVVGWQEIANTPLEAGTVVQFWDPRVDSAPFVEAAKAGAKFLMSPGSKTYLDMKYDASTELGQDWAGYIELRDAYDWDPETLIEGMPAGAVIGVEAAIWTETLRDLPSLMSMLLPRLAAVAEVAWTAHEQQDWDDFRERVAGQAAFWDRLGLRWYPSTQVDWRR
ncbi:MAG: family 20 glycosylhydrolase [Brevundimonas sp.]